MNDGNSGGTGASNGDAASAGDGGAAGFDPARFARFMSRHGHAGFVGLAYADHGPDWVELRFDWRAELVGDLDSGIIASGPVITLMDNVMSVAVWTRLGDFRPHATMDLRVDYLRPSPPGVPVIGRGICYHLTHNIGFVRGIAHNGDPADPLAHATATFVRTDISAWGQS